MAAKPISASTPLTGNAALAHFAALGKALAETQRPEPPPRDLTEVIERMLAIDPNCGRGTPDPLGGDWPSHLAYVRNRAKLLERLRSAHGGKP
ncbi:MAG: hypothetical protein F4Y86_02170 [Gammaproteobacteria bacterium]|nr:hypothetical protein [Gammaproteobacteria bacterium]